MFPFLQGSFEDLWDIHDPVKLGLENSVSPTSFPLCRTGCYDLVCSRVSALADEPGEVCYLTLSGCVQIQIYISLHLTIREERALKILAYYHANGNE